MGTQYFGTGRLGTHRNIAYTGTAGSTGTINTGVQKIRVYVTSAAYVKVGTAAVATTSDVPMAADAPEYFSVRSGEKVSAIQVSGAGTLHVTEIV
jgi:hypothetical protein